jgi:RecB family exonuclease
MSSIILTAKPAERKSLDLSVSKVKTFKDCPAKFRYTYIEKLPRKEWEHHIFGTFLHEVLETFHQTIIEGSTDPDHLIMTLSFKESLKNFGAKLTKKAKDEAWAIIKSYLMLIKSQKEEQILPIVKNVEKGFYIDIDGKVLLNGYIDRVQNDSDGILHVADYKTTKNKKYLKNDWFQLETYAFVLFLEDPNLQKIKGSYILLRHNFEFITKEFTRDILSSTESSFLKYAEQILSEKIYRANPTRLCDYCDFKDVCKDGKRFLGKNDIVKYGQKDW